MFAPGGRVAQAVAVEFSYKRAVSRSYAETVEAVERTISSHGFDVVSRHDVRAALEAKGFEIQPLLILNVLAPGARGQSCRLNVYAEGDAVWVSAIRPSVLAQLTDDGAAAGDIGDIEARVIALVDDSVS